MSIQEIVKELEFNTGTFPREALQAAIVHRERVIPELLRILEEAKADVKRLVRQESYIGHIYALYLLAQFRETRAYPLIVDFFSIPGEITLDLTGDVVTEDLDRILASVCGGDTTLMESLAENRSANGYVRNAALRAMLVLVARGVKSREDVMGYYQRLFRGGLERQPALVWAGLVSCCCDLYPEEVLQDIEEAYAENLVDEADIDFEWVSETLARGKDRVLGLLTDSAKYRYVEDTIREIEWWACFDAPEQHQVLTRKVGRNEPCPCGSGRKYKRCCGARR